jgi:hypothetical protein
MRKLLFLVLAMLLPAGIQAAVACSPVPGRGSPSHEELYARGTAVLLVHITRVEEIKIERASASASPMVTLEGIFRVNEALKGTPPADGKFKAVVLLRCGLPLLAGVDYLLFLDPANRVLDGNDPGSNAGARFILKGPDGKMDRMSQDLLEKLRDLARQGPK